RRRPRTSCGRGGPRRGSASRAASRARAPSRRALPPARARPPPAAAHARASPRRVPGAPHARMRRPRRAFRARAVSTLRVLPADPAWSHLYRKMTPLLAAAGCRPVAPDLVGSGRSDKPTAPDDYTYQRHVDWMRALLERLDLREVTLVCQDWGGLIGLRLVAEHPERFARVVAANTFLPTGDRPAGPAFLAWQRYSQETPELPVGRIVQGGCVTELPAAVLAAYDAPFPDEHYKAGPRRFPLLVPT